MKPVTETGGIVLKKVLRGESGVLFYILSPDEGIVTCMKRVAVKKSSALPDLFDTVTFRVGELRTGDLKFIQDFELHESRIGLAKNYGAFVAATELSEFVSANGRDLETHKKLYEIFGASLGALMAGANPEVVKIKFFYVLLKDEGYPVKESFAFGLNGDEMECLKQILSTPSLDCKADAEASRLLLEKFTRWILSETEFRI